MAEAKEAQSVSLRGKCLNVAGGSRMYEMHAVLLSFALGGGRRGKQAVSGARLTNTSQAW